MPYSIPDHPAIRNAERTGYPDGKEPEYPHCPICRSDTDTFYRNSDYEIVGCSKCIRAVDAWENYENAAKN